MANIENLSFLSPSAFQIPEGEGFTNGSTYPNPGSEENTRKYLQTQHSQIKKYINDTLVVEENSKEERISKLEDDVDDLQDNEITNIASDGTFQINKVGKVYNLSLAVSPEGVTKQYVDNQDASTLAGAKEYTDEKMSQIDLLNGVYPIGSIYMSVNDTNPSTLFGGTWVQLKDRFLLGAGDTYEGGDTGGEATHQLTINEMPSHSHTYDKGITNAYNFGGDGYHPLMQYQNTNTSSVGGNEAHNNMPPYLVVYMWKRTA